MFNPLFSLIICLDRDSPPAKYYEATLRDFTDSMGVYLQIDGDPFQYECIGQLLRACAAYGIEGVGIRTDQLRDQDIAMMQQYGVRSVMFRLQSTNPCKNDRLLGRMGTLGDLVGNVGMASAAGIPVEVSVIVCQENWDELDCIINWSSNNGITLLVLERTIIASYRGFPLTTISPHQYEQLLRKVVDYNQTPDRHDQSRPRMGIALSHCPNKVLVHQHREEYLGKLGGCSAGIVSCAIDVSGEIVPCLPLSKVKLGNIQETSLGAVWRGAPELLFLRDRNNLRGRCGVCEYKYSCGGCRAESYAKNGSLMGEDGSCWKQ